VDHVDFASGAPQNPLGREAVSEKFAALAARVLPRSVWTQLKAAVLSLETQTDLRALTRYLQTEP
jgi:hypothetical protein